MPVYFLSSRIRIIQVRFLSRKFVFRAQRLAVEPPGRLCTHRFSIQQAPSKTLGALTPGRRPGRFQPRVGRFWVFIFLFSNNLIGFEFTYSTFFLLLIHTTANATNRFSFGLIYSNIFSV